MNENSDEKLDGLFAAACAVRPETSSLEQYFETRVMASIRERNNRTAWPVLAWRMIPLFMTIVFILLATNLAFKPDRSGDYFAAITTEEEDYMARF